MILHDHSRIQCIRKSDEPWIGAVDVYAVIDTGRRSGTGTLGYVARVPKRYGITDGPKVWAYVLLDDHSLSVDRWNGPHPTRKDAIDHLLSAVRPMAFWLGPPERTGGAL